MIIQCPKCETRFQVDENLNGKTARCSSCSETFRVDGERAVDSGLVEAGRPGGMSVFGAFMLGLLVLGAIGAAWWYLPLWGEREPLFELPDWSKAIGHFHPLLVHLPIGLLIGATAIEFLTGRKRSAARASAVTGLLWMATLSAGIAAIAGFIWAREDGSGSSELFRRHLYGAVALLVLLAGALFFKVIRERSPATRGRGAYRFFMLLACLALGFTGHLGGSMTHGPNFLTKHLPAPAREAIEPVFALMEGRKVASKDGGDDAAANDAESAEAAFAKKPFFEGVIQPIFDSKCVACHGPDKVKGKLRMDTLEHLMAGADGDGSTIIAGDVEGSSALFRIALPIDDDEHMPPEDKDQMTDEEVALVTWWVKSGADPAITIADAEVPENLAPALAAVTTAAVGVAAVDVTAEAGSDSAPVDKAAPSQTYSEEEVAIAVEKINTEMGARLAPTFSGSENYSFNALNVIDSFGDEQLTELAPVATKITELNLARSKVTDKGLAEVGKMSELVTLKLENTAVTDAGLVDLAGLEKLESINLYGTKVTDEGLRQLAELPSLKRVYVWQTGVSEKAADALSWLKPELKVDVGYKEEDLRKPVEEKPAEEAKAEPEKKENPKPVDKKPEAKKEDPKPAPEKKEEAKPADKKPEPAQEKSAPAPKKPGAEKKDPAKAQPKPEEKPKSDPAPAAKEEAKKPAPKQNQAQRKAAQEKRKAAAAKKAVEEAAANAADTVKKD